MLQQNAALACGIRALDKYLLHVSLQAAAAWRPVQHAWVTPQHFHLRHFANGNDIKASSADAAAEEADQAAAAAADQAAADEQAGSSELSELQELLKKAEEEVMVEPSIDLYNQ
jgi:hypothetical protein